MFKKQKPLKVALDCDDVLFPCVQLAIDTQNKTYGFDPPITMDEATDYSLDHGRINCLLECFEKPAFFRKQRPYEGAQDFVRKLCDKAEVYILTAVPVCGMGIRAEMIRKYFPEIPEDHIILTKAKDMVDIDVLLDDSPNNILKTTAKYPVVMKKPWNNHLTGVLAVHNYDEFLVLIDEIIHRFDEMELDSTKPRVVGIVGMSGSGKSTLAQKLVETGRYEQARTYTDRPKRDESDTYHFVSTEEFERLKENGDIFESTVYSGHNYGSSASVIQSILDKGKNAVIPVDICGAISLKTHFDNVVTVFVNREKRQIVEAILNRNCSNEDKVNRIMSIEAEQKNAEICDYILNNEGDLDSVMDELLNVLES